jgi:hypothetical protein
MSDLRKLLDLVQENSDNNEPEIGDYIELEMGDSLLETYIEDITEDGVIIRVDETALSLMIDAKKQLNENMHSSEYNPEYDDEAGMADNNLETMRRAVDGIDDLISHGDNLPEWCQEKIAVAKSMLVSVWDYMKSEEERGAVNEEDLGEAEYQGRKVPLNKPMKGDVKKSKVYVKKPNGKIVKVNFGDKKMRIKKSNPNRRKSFRARHRCENPGPKWKARYWSCRAW